MTKEHDPQVCGIDPATDCEQCKPQTLRLRRLEALQERLEKAGISVSDLACLLLMQIDDYLDDQVERIVEERMRSVLRRVSLRARIDWTSLDWTREQP